ncbi:conserved hypothetical protein [Ricinus communis]|uniref:Uncharacterized protein n=1 Tax=Ricinus communis TaxID=3988 RepID=B9T3V7_RICCO|nr:conserved hypothetical protein [Ricinus communis]
MLQVTQSGIPYVDSLTRFAKDLGPTAQNVANKKLGMYPIEAAANSASWNPSSFGRTADCLFPKPPAFPSPANLNGRGNEGQMPYNFIPNTSASYKGKMVCTNGGTSTYGGESIPNYNSLGTRPYTTNGGLTDYNLLGQEGANTSRNTGGCVFPTEKATGTGDSMDLLIATLNQIGAIQNRNNHTPSGTYYPLTGYADLPPASSQINNMAQPWLLNKPSESSCLPYSSDSRATTSLYPSGEGTSAAAPAALNQNYMAQTIQSVQPEEWKQSALWGLPPICDLPVLQTNFNDQQIPLMQQQQSPQVPLAQDIPSFNTMNFLGGANPQGYHRAESSNAQCFWNTHQSSLMSNKQPDLDLQL